MYAITTSTKSGSNASLASQASAARSQQGLDSMRASDRVAMAFDGTGAAILKFERNETIYYEGDDADYCYKVVSGTVRLCKITEDGRRQIAAFLMAGDVFGWTDQDAHNFSAEAVSEAKVERLSRTRTNDAMKNNPAMGRSFLGLISSQLAAAHDHLLLLGRMTANERVAWFLLDLVKRVRRADAKASTLDLAMNRKDIADYLGLTIETVSRVMNQLKRKGMITLATPDHVVLTQTNALERMAMAA